MCIRDRGNRWRHRRAKRRGRRRGEDEKPRRSGKQPEAPACKKEGPKERRSQKALPEREIARGTGVQKSEAEGKEKTKSPAGAGNRRSRRRAKRRGRRGGEDEKPPPEREIERAAGVQKGGAEGEEKTKSPAGAGNRWRHRRAKRRGRRRGEDEKPRRGGK